MGNVMRLSSALLALLCLTGCPPKDAQAPDPKAQADGLYLAGTAAYMKGDFKEAHDRYAEVKKLNPTDPRLPAAEGEVYLAEVKLDDALKSFEEAVKLEPKRATTWSRIGFIHSLKGRPAEAKEALTKALELNPRDFNALESVAEMDLKEKNLDEAVKHFLAASAAAPDQARAPLVMRAVEELTKGGRDADALKLLEETVKKGVKSPEMHSELGDRLVAAGRLPEAVAAYTDAAKANPADPALWELVGELHMKLDKPADAEAAFRESLRVKDRGVVHASLARLCQARKDAECTRNELDQALNKASGEEPRELIDIADLLASVGRKADALALLKGLADEEESAGDGALQLKLAKLAKDVGDKVTVKSACDRVLASDAGVKKCP
jgi:tetratricopeptide (TPR) repeat protein